MIPMETPPELSNACHAYSRWLAPVLNYNDRLNEAYSDLDAALRRRNALAEKALGFFMLARTLRELCRIFKETTPNDQERVNQLFAASDAFYQATLRQGHPESPTARTHPTAHGVYLQSARRARALLTSTADADHIRRFFDDVPIGQSGRNDSLRGQVLEFLRTSTLALTELVVASDEHENMCEDIEVALVQGLDEPTSNVGTPIKEVLRAGVDTFVSLAQSAIGNMPNPGDTFSVWLVKFRMERLVATMPDRTALDETRTAARDRLVRAGLPQEAADRFELEVRRAVARGPAGEQPRRAHLARAREVLDRHYQSGPLTSGIIGFLSIYTVATAIIEVEDDPENFQAWLKLGAAAGDAVTSIPVGMHRLFSPLLASRTVAVSAGMARLGTRFITGATYVGWALGIVLGVVDIIEGVRDENEFQIVIGSLTAGGSILMIAGALATGGSVTALYAPPAGICLLALAGMLSIAALMVEGEGSTRLERVIEHIIKQLWAARADSEVTFEEVEPVEDPDDDTDADIDGESRMRRPREIRPVPRRIVHVIDRESPGPTPLWRLLRNVRTAWEEVDFGPARIEVDLRDQPALHRNLEVIGLGQVLGIYRVRGHHPGSMQPRPAE